MTDGERMVWAAVYARNYNRIDKSEGRPDGSQAAQEWAKAKVMDSIERAGCAVEYLREVREELKEWFGDDSDIHKMYLEMVDETQSCARDVALED